MKTKHPRNGLVAKRVSVKGRRMVMLDESEFDRLMPKAGEFEPLLPELPPDEVLAYVSVSWAHKIITDRRGLGLTQADLARRAGIRAESLNRIEKGRTEHPHG